MFTFQQVIEELQRRYPGCGLGRNLENEYGQQMQHMMFREATYPDCPAVFVAVEDQSCTIWYQETCLPGQAGLNRGISCGTKPWPNGQPHV